RRLFAVALEGGRDEVGDVACSMLSVLLSALGVAAKFPFRVARPSVGRATPGGLALNNPTVGPIARPIARTRPARGSTPEGERRAAGQSARPGLARGSAN